jgi:hypothetical protein
MECFLLEVEFEALHDEVLQAIEDVLLDETQIAGQFLVVDELLDLVVEADALGSREGTKFL